MLSCRITITAARAGIMRREAIKGWDALLKADTGLEKCYRKRISIILRRQSVSITSQERK